MRGFGLIILAFGFLAGTASFSRTRSIFAYLKVPVNSACG
jgi:hypothetical protein